jgi:hypothetical protein
MPDCGIPLYISNDPNYPNVNIGSHWERQWPVGEVYIRINLYLPYTSPPTIRYMRVNFPKSDLPVTLKKLNDLKPQESLLSFKMYGPEGKEITDPDETIPLETLSTAVPWNRDGCMRLVLWRGDMKPVVTSPPTKKHAIVLRRGGSSWTKELYLTDSEVTLRNILPRLTGHGFGDMNSYAIRITGWENSQMVYLSPGLERHRDRYPATRILDLDYSLFDTSFARDYVLTLTLESPTAETTQGPDAETTRGPDAETTQGPDAETRQGPAVKTTQGPTQSPASDTKKFFRGLLDVDSTDAFKKFVKEGDNQIYLGVLVGVCVLLIVLLML